MESERGATKFCEVIAYRPFLPMFDTWVEVRDGDPYGRDLFSRHYSKYHYKDGRKPKLFVGPGEKLVLMTVCGRALFVWRKFISSEKGVSCSIFRNESGRKSSELIIRAVAIAHERWPGERLFTYVNPRKIKSVNPGYCFKMAGFRFCGVTKKNKLHILEYTG